MDYQALNTELVSDPLGRGYAGMTDQEAADDLATEYRTRNKTSLSGDEAFTATDTAEFAALNTSQLQHKLSLWVAFTSKDAIDPFNAANIAFVDFVFGPSSATKTALAALRSEAIPRWQEIGIGEAPNAGHIAHARTL